MKPVSYEEQMMSKNKYPRTFSRQMVAIVRIILLIYFCNSGFVNWGILRGYFLVLVGEYSVIGRVYTNPTQSKIIERL